MKVLLVTLGSYGDVYPFVGLGVHLKRRGHQVTLLTNPFFADLARRYGLGFVRLGTPAQHDRFANHPALFDPRRGVAALFEHLVVPGIREGYARILERIVDEPTVLVSSVVVFAARLAQETHGVPNVTLHLSPMAFKSAHEMPRNAFLPFPGWSPTSLKRLYWWVADRAVVDRMLGPELNALRSELGLAPVRRIMTRWGHSPERVIGLFPRWYAQPQPDWPAVTRLTGFPLFSEGEDSEPSAEVEAFLEAGEPPIVFMPGSLMKHAGRFLDCAVRACQELERRAILLSRDHPQVPAGLPPTIRHFDYVPFAHVLPRAAALVHHGGIGTCAQALRAGVPQLVHPLAYDQFDNAWRLKRLGVGDRLIPGRLRPTALADRLAEITTSSDLRRCCKEVERRFHGEDAIAATCDWIEAAL